MGCSRETQDLFRELREKRFWNFWRLIKRFDRITYEDTFMPIICKIFKHNPYQPEPEIDPTEWACKRCHRYIKAEEILEDKL